MILKPNCKECPLGDCPQVGGLGTRTEGSKLFAVREEDTQFDLVTVAMAPAAEEMQRGMPMVGRSGQFFRKIIGQLGIESYYITNCLLCPIPLHATTAEISLAQKCCQARLESEILAHKPLLILGLGDMPFHELCDNQLPVLEHQGRLFMTHLNIPLVPVAHPAYYLRRPDDAYDFIECTRAGIRYLTNNYHQVGEVTRELVTPQTASKVLEELWKHDILTVDTETTGLDMLSLHPCRLLEVGISYNDEHCYIIKPNLVPLFKELLETKKIDGWNLFFDWRVMRTVDVNMQNLRFDGMLAHYCLDERQKSHGLKKVSRIYVGAEDWEAEIKKYLPSKDSSYELIPEEVRHTYLSKDVCYSRKVNTLLNEEVKGNWAFWNILIPVTYVFSETLYRGIPIDPHKVLEIHQILAKDIQRDERELWNMAGHYFNPSSPPDVAEILYDEMGIPIDAREGRTTNKKIIEKWRDDYEFVDRIIDHREMLHDINQYVVGFAQRIDSQFRVHPSIKLHGAVTGRISSEDPSIMNIKRDSSIKEIFVASEGKLLAEFDLKGAELRWYCMYAEDDVLRDILVNGFQGDIGHELTDEQRKDPHYMIGAIAYGPDRAKELRAAAKMTVFGRIYLRGLKSIERQYGRETGQSLIRVMDQLIPNHKYYTKKIKDQIKNQGYVKSYFDRLRRFPLITEQNRKDVERQGVNMPIQSASSDLNLLNLIWLFNHKEEFNVWPMFTVHDSIMVEIPDESVIGPIKHALEENARKIVKGEMEFVYDVKFGESWGAAKEWKGD